MYALPKREKKGGRWYYVAKREGYCAMCNKGKVKPPRKFCDNCSDEDERDRYLSTDLARELGITKNQHNRKLPKPLIFKEMASRWVQYAVEFGYLPDLKETEILCLDCKKVRATAYDHRDYLKPLDVQPVCLTCNFRRGPGINRHEIDLPKFT